MHLEEQIDLLKHQIHEMDQDIENYLDEIERYKKALKKISNFYEENKYFPTYELTISIVKEALEV